MIDTESFRQESLGVVAMQTRTDLSRSLLSAVPGTHKMFSCQGNRKLHFMTNAHNSLLTSAITLLSNCLLQLEEDVFPNRECSEELVAAGGQSCWQHHQGFMLTAHSTHSLPPQRRHLLRVAQR